MLIFAAGIVPDKTHTGFGVTILGISHIQKGLFLSKMKKKKENNLCFTAISFNRGS